MVKLLLPYLLLLFSIIEITAQSGKNTVYDIIKHDSVILVSTGCGVFCTTTLNGVWDLKSTQDDAVRIAVKQDSLVALAQGGGISMTSLSDPNAWTQKRFSLPKNDIGVNDTLVFASSYGILGFLYSPHCKGMKTHLKGMPYDSTKAPGGNLWIPKMNVSSILIWTISCTV